MTDKKSTLQKVGDILSDVADIFALGSRVVKETGELCNHESRQQFLTESDQRAKQLHDMRNGGSSEPRQ